MEIWRWCGGDRKQSTGHKIWKEQRLCRLEAQLWWECSLSLHLKSEINCIPPTWNIRQHTEIILAAFSSGTVLGDLTPGTQAQNDICCQTAFQAIISEVTFHDSVHVGRNVRSTRASVWQESHLYIRGSNLNDEKSSSPTPSAVKLSTSAACLSAKDVWKESLTSEARLAACSWTGMGLRFSKRFRRSWICQESTTIKVRSEIKRH